MARAQAQAALIVGIKPMPAELAAIDPKTIRHLEAYRVSAVEAQGFARYMSCPFCACIGKDPYAHTVEQGQDHYYCACCGSVFRA
jgi:hypothetical protein